MNLITLSINNNNQLANDFFSLLSYRIKHNHLIIFISIFFSAETKSNANARVLHTHLSINFSLLFLLFHFYLQVQSHSLCTQIHQILCQGIIRRKWRGPSTSVSSKLSLIIATSAAGQQQKIAASSNFFVVLIKSKREFRCWFNTHINKIKYFKITWSSQ